MPKGEPPFAEFDYYDTVRSDGRIQVILQKLGPKKVITMLLSRYRMSVKLNRILDTDEEVDHIDDNPFNDNLSNLQILCKKAHGQKRKKLVKLNCTYCSKEIYKPEYRVNDNLNRGFSNNFCNGSCRTKYQFRKKA